jgi:hypothetical protein
LADRVQLRINRNVDVLRTSFHAAASVRRRTRPAASMLGMPRLVLRDGLTFTEIATRAQARGSRAQVAQVADRFRWSLQCLADGWSGRAR